jgi:quercetin dioxygenase-like cupin family protein
MHLHNLSQIKAKEVFPGYSGKFIHTNSMTFAFWDVKAGSIVPEHSHMHEQVAQVIEGKFELTVDGKRYELEAGQLITIPSNIKHSGIAITNCKLLDVFTPVREDYRF